MDLLLQVGQIYLASERHTEVVTLANAYAAPYPSAAENLVNQVGYDLLRRGQLERPLEAFKKNAEAFGAAQLFKQLSGPPKHARRNPHDSAGIAPRRRKVAHRLTPRAFGVSYSLRMISAGCTRAA